MQYQRGSIGLFFRGDPTLRDYLIFDNRATNYGSSAAHGTVTSVIYKNGELLNGIDAADFHGVGYIDLGIHHLPSTAGTVMFWAKVRNNTTAQTFFQDGGGGLIDLQEVANTFRCRFYDGTWKNINMAHTLITPDRKQLITMTWDSSYVRVYIDDKYQSSVAAGALSYDSDYAFVVGAYWNGSNPLDGFISEFAVFSRTLDKNEISQYYRWATSPKPKLTVTYTVPAVNNAILFSCNF